MSAVKYDNFRKLLITSSVCSKSFSKIFFTHIDIVFKEKGKVENMPLGPDRCNGPSGYMDSTIPPPTLKRAKGSISEYTSYYLHVDFSHFHTMTVTHLVYCNNKVLIFALFFPFGLSIISLGIVLWYGLWVYIMILIGISFDIRTARVQCRGVAPPTLVTRPPPGNPYFPECYVNTCALVGVT